MKKDKSISIADMPDKEAFEKKEIYQHPQPADSGKPLNKDEKKKMNADPEKDSRKTKKEPGLNEENSPVDEGTLE